MEEKRKREENRLEIKWAFNKAKYIWKNFTNIRKRCILDIFQNSVKSEKSKVDHSEFMNGFPNYESERNRYNEIDIENIMWF